MHESLVAGPQRDLSARRKAQFREHTAHIGFHRPFAHHQQPGHLGIGFALPNQGATCRSRSVKPLYWSAVARRGETGFSLGRVA